MHKLVICDDEGKTTIVPMIRDEITIGRKVGNTIRLTERNVSRNHARLSRQDEIYSIEDLGSLLGTKVAGKPLRSESVPVAINDQFMIGDYSLSIRTDVSADVPLGCQIASGDEAGIGKVTAHARLVVLQGPELGREIDLTADLYVIGRSDEANCRIADPSISRAHARIDLEGNHWTISDLDSVNGILINGFRKDDYVLKAGDVIELGGVRLRFVASGEPYEYRPPTTPVSRSASTAPAAPEPSATPERRPHALLWGLGFVALVATLGIALMLFMGGKGLDPAKDGEGTASTDEAAEQSYNALMELGKDMLQTQSWAEAAKLFALALEKQPADPKAKELKQLALTESDAKAAFDKAAAATKQSAWGEAYTALVSIPRASHYYDESWLTQAVREYCRELTEATREALRFSKFLRAEEALSTIANLSKVPNECETIRQQLHVELATKLREAAESGTAPMDAGVMDFRVPADRPRGVGPADKPPHEPKKSAPVTTPKMNDLMTEARAALDRGDRDTAITILEQKGRGDRNALALLATLHMQAGNRLGYETVANRFIQLFPNDPKTPQFKRNLGR